MKEEQIKPTDLRKRRQRFSWFVSAIYVLILLLITLQTVRAEEWYEGGNLQQASVNRWLKASEANRLATSADWFMAMTKKTNKVLLEEMKAMGKEDYEKAFKYYVTHLESCISEKLEKKTVRYEDKVVDYAEKCYKVLHGGDTQED